MRHYAELGITITRLRAGSFGVVYLSTKCQCLWGIHPQL